MAKGGRLGFGVRVMAWEQKDGSRDAPGGTGDLECAHAKLPRVAQAGAKAAGGRTGSRWAQWGTGWGEKSRGGVQPAVEAAGRRGRKALQDGKVQAGSTGGSDQKQRSSAGHKKGSGPGRAAARRWLGTLSGGGGVQGGS